MKKAYLSLVALLALTSLGSCASQGAQGEKGEQGVAGLNGSDGKNGTDGLTPYIGENGNWWLGETDTGVKAKGEDGVSPTIEIGDNGNWYINDADTGVSAKGEKGDPGDKGQDGSQILTGTSAPSNETGNVGDFYIDTNTGDYYTKGEEGWVVTGNIKGKDGKDGTTPSIGENGNWWIGDTDTGVKAEGEDGKTPTIVIGTNGNWWINGQDSGVSAKGEKGDQGIQGEKGDPGDKGTDGTTPSIGENGNWWIGTTDTGISAKGEDGSSPEVKIGDNGNWFINGTDTGVSAKGEKGDAGEKGDTGTAVKSIEKTGSNGNVDTYTITFSDGSTTTFEVTNGKDAVTYIPAIFYNYDGTKLYEFYYEKGSTVTYPLANPTKPDTVEHGYTRHWTFDGWDKSLENITEPTVFTAKYSSLLTATFMTLNEKGEYVIGGLEDVEFGETPVYKGTTPTKATTTDSAGTKIEWTFTGWDKAFEPIYENITYYALFSSPNEVRATFLNEDGTLLGYSYCYIGDSVTYKGPTPTKADVNNNGTITRYTFAGWNLPTENLKLDRTFYATYTASTYYVCSFVDYDGRVIEDNIEVLKGSSITAPTSPSREVEANNGTITEYTFSSWSGGDLTSITAPTTFTATYTENSYSGYLVKFYNENGKFLAKTAVQPGEKAKYPNSISEVIDDCYSYDIDNVTMFFGWDHDLSSVSSDLNVIANTKQVKRDYNGEYQGDRVSDSELIAALDASTTDYSGYHDLDGKRYYCSGKGNWNVSLPIKWRYLADNGNSTYKLMSEHVLATEEKWSYSESADDDGNYPNNYKISRARADLIASMNTWFKDTSALETVNVDNSTATTDQSNPIYSCDNTDDKIYLPSYQDLTNSDYGFDNDNDRIATGLKGEIMGYWTRSPYGLGGGPKYVSYVAYHGGLRAINAYMGTNLFGLRPCVTMKII